MLVIRTRRSDTRVAISESSVREHVKTILWKMGARNRTEAATRAPKVEAGPNARNYHPRYGPNGLPTEAHSTGERVIQ